MLEEGGGGGGGLLSDAAGGESCCGEGVVVRSMTGFGGTREPSASEMLMSTGRLRGPASSGVVAASPNELLPPSSLDVLRVELRVWLEEEPSPGEGHHVSGRGDGDSGCVDVPHGGGVGGGVGHQSQRRQGWKTHPHRSGCLERGR